MKLKNFFLSCSSTSGSRSRKVEEKQQKYGGLRPVSPPPPSTSTLATKSTIYPTVSADLRQDYYTAPIKKHLTNSYSSYSCGSASSHSSSKSTGASSSSGIGSSNIGSYSSSSNVVNPNNNSNTNSFSKNKRTLDSRSGRHRSERQKPKCTSRQCCNNGNNTDFNHKITLADYDVGPSPLDDLGEFF
jgi:hypothetical protein